MTISNDGRTPAEIPLSDRIKEAAELIEISEGTLTKSLKKSGIDDTEKGLALLNSDIVTDRDLLDILECIQTQEDLEEIPHLKKKAAVAILRGNNPFKQDDNKYYPPKGEDRDQTLAESIAAGLKQALPKSDFKQLKDKELLELYIEDKDYEVEQELHRRAKHQPFVVLDSDKKINVEASIDLLKRARKMVNPSMVPVGDTVVPVYRITEVNPDDNIIEICPICGEILYKGYCDKCELNFASVGDEERAYVNLISRSSNFKADSYSDKKAVIASATKGLEDLRKTWPGASKQFDELKLTNNLPSLRKVRSLPSVKPADPFNVK